jgi:seryl-tRNA synthetase
MFRSDEIRKEQKTASKSIGGLMKAKAEGWQAAVAETKARVVTLKNELKANTEEVAALEKKTMSLISAVGNYVHESVPVGLKEEAHNTIHHTWGEFKRTGNEKHHHELLWMIGGYEPERGVKTAGHRAYFLTDVGVLLNQALIQYGLAFLRKKKFKAVQPPLFMNKEVMAETAQLSQFDEELYKVVGNNGDEKYLIATSEQPISAYHRGEWISEAELKTTETTGPFRYAGVSTCFRKEAGSHGKDTWGIFRIHQFEKIEQFVVTAPEDSWEEHDRMLANSEEFYQSLGISYQVVLICSGALNNAAAKKYDLEAWFPTLGTFRELVSCSNCTDYQSRAMDIRYGANKAREKNYVHMLNSTLTATERTICCILENYQTETGVRVPEVLQPYMGGIDFMPFVREAPVNITANKQKAAKKKGQKTN